MLALLFTLAGAAGDPVGSGPPSEARQWAKALAMRAKDSPSFASLNDQLRAAEIAARGQRELPPWRLASRLEEQRSPRAPSAAIAPSRNLSTRLQSEVAKYVGAGVNFSATLGLMRASYQPTVLGRSDAASGWEAGADVSVDLWRDRGGRFTEAEREARALTYVASSYEVLAERDTLLLDLLERSLEYCVATVQWERARDVGTVLTTLLRDTSARSQAQIVPASDTVQFEKLLATMERSQEELAGQRQALADALASAYGLDLASATCPQVVLSGDPPDRSASPPAPAPGGNPSLLASNQRVRQREREAEVAELALAPTLRPYVGVSGVDERADFLEATRELWGRHAPWAVVAGVELVWELGNMGAQATREATLITLSAERARREGIEDSLRGEIATTQIQMKSAQASYSILQRHERLARQHLDIESARYALGRASALSLTTAYQDFLQVVMAQPAVAMQSFKAEWRLEALHGRLALDLLGE